MSMKRNPCYRNITKTPQKMRLGVRPTFVNRHDQQKTAITGPFVENYYWHCSSIVFTNGAESKCPINFHFVLLSRRTRHHRLWWAWKMSSAEKTMRDATLNSIVVCHLNRRQEMMQAWGYLYFRYAACGRIIRCEWTLDGISISPWKSRVHLDNRRQRLITRKTRQSKLSSCARWRIEVLKQSEWLILRFIFCTDDTIDEEMRTTNERSSASFEARTTNDWLEGNANRELTRAMTLLQPEVLLRFLGRSLLVTGLTKDRFFSRYCFHRSFLCNYELPHQGPRNNFTEVNAFRTINICPERWLRWANTVESLRISQRDRLLLKRLSHRFFTG